VRTIIIFATIAALTATTAHAAPPNIVIVLADDLGSGQVTRIGSPEIAKFAARGLTFRNAYAGSALCAPSRATLMTGRHTGHVAPRGNGRRIALDPDDVTIAEMLKEAGYATGLFGKWGFGRRDKPETWPEQHGWQESLAYLSHTDAHDHTPDYLWQDGAPVDLSGEYAQDLFDDAARGVHRPPRGPAVPALRILRSAASAPQQLLGSRRCPLPARRSHIAQAARKLSQ